MSKIYKEGDPNIKNINTYDLQDDYYNQYGITDWGYLSNVDVYEGGFCFLGVLSAPKIHKYYHNTKASKIDEMNEPFKDLQDTFIKILEHDFRGLSGLDDITTDTNDLSDNISGTRSFISDTVTAQSSDFSMKYFEKRGTPLSHYVDRYLNYISDPVTKVKMYHSLTECNVPHKYYGIQNECFTLLYFVTDSTMLHIDKAFLIVDAQLRSLSQSELYEFDKGTIEPKEITLNWTGTVIKGFYVNNAAAEYLKVLSKVMRLNSYDYNWSISKGNENKHLDELGVSYNEDNKRYQID